MQKFKALLGFGIGLTSSLKSITNTLKYYSLDKADNIIFTTNFVTRAMIILGNIFEIIEAKRKLNSNQKFITDLNLNERQQEMFGIKDTSIKKLYSINIFFLVGNISMIVLSGKNFKNEPTYLSLALSLAALIYVITQKEIIDINSDRKDKDQILIKIIENKPMHREYLPSLEPFSRFSGLFRKHFTTESEKNVINCILDFYKDHQDFLDLQNLFTTAEKMDRKYLISGYVCKRSAEDGNECLRLIQQAVEISINCEKNITTRLSVGSTSNSNDSILIDYTSIKYNQGALKVSSNNQILPALP